MIKDTMKKSAPLGLLLTFFSFATAGGMIIQVMRDPTLLTEFVKKLIIGFILMGLVGIYAWLDLITYEFILEDDKISVKKLFKKTEIQMSDISHYSYRLYTKFSGQYIFVVHTENSAFSFYTRHNDELLKALQDHGIEQK